MLSIPVSSLSLRPSCWHPLSSVHPGLCGTRRLRRVDRDLDASPQPVWDAEFFVPSVCRVPSGTRRCARSRRSAWREARACGSVQRVRTKPLVMARPSCPRRNGRPIVAGSDRALSFGGNPSVTIPPGAPVISDPVDLTVAPLGSVAVSLFLPEQTPLTTFHWEGVQTA